MENSSPNPSFSIWDFRTQKQMSRSFGESSSYRSCTPFTFLSTKCSRSCESVPHFLTPKNSFAKTSSALFRHLPEYLEGRTPKEKHPFLFQKKFHPCQIRNARSVFLSGLPRLCEAVAGRFIHHCDFARNTFELCPEHTAVSGADVGKKQAF